MTQMGRKMTIYSKLTENDRLQRFSGCLKSDYTPKNQNFAIQHTATTHTIGGTSR